MRLYILLTIACLFSIPSFAQQIMIKGIVKDAATNEGLEFATVVLMNNDSSVVKGAMTNAEGMFELEVTKGDYILKSLFIGYKENFKNIKITGAENTHDAGTISLTSDNVLESAVVIGRKSFIQQKIDRYVVAIPAYQSGRSAIDVLRTTPGVIVQNKNISLISGEVKIWINGRPSQMSGEQLASFLEGLQADDINDIEVITSPSAKYDAEGSGGIINIRLKRNVSDLFNGSVNAGYELSKAHIGVGGLNLNYRKGITNVYGSYNIRGGNNESTMDEVTNTGTQIYNKHVDGETYRYLSNNYRAGIDIAPNDKNIFGVLFTGFNNDNRMSLLSSTSITPALNNTAFSEMDGNNVDKHNGKMYNINYKHQFNKPGQEFSIDGDYAHFSNNKNQNQTYSFRGSNGNESELELLERSYLPQKNDIWSVKADYSHPVKEGMMMETGAKASNSHTDNDYKYEELENGNWINVSGKNNYFKYDESIFAAYLNFSHEMGKWRYMAGLRAENTKTKGNQVTTNQVNKKSYLDWFPSVYVQYLLAENHTFTISYRRRFDRPDYSLLNPFEQVLDKYSFIKGNPYLNPGYGNIYDLRYSYSSNFMANFNITDLTDRIFAQPVIESDDRYGYTYENFARRTAYVLQLNYNNEFFKIWRMNAMGQFAYIYQNTGESVTEFKNSGLSGFFMVNNDFRVTKSFSLNLNFMMMPASRMGYIKNENLVNNLSFGLYKRLFNNKGSLSLSVNDILYGQKAHTTSDYRDMHIRTKEDANTRNITIGFRYNFGSDKVKGARQRSIGIEEEVGRSVK